jgi:hypothetical protein
MGGAEGSREVQAGGARSMGSLYICVKTPARSGVHEGPHWSCMQPWVVDPVSLSCRKVTYPTAQGRASLARLLRLLLLVC